MRHADIREKMADLLDELPTFVEECENYKRIYPGSKSLQWYVEELYISLLRAMEDVVLWYTQSSISESTYPI